MNTVLLLIIILCMAVQQVSQKSYNSKTPTGVTGFTALIAFFAAIFFLITSSGELDFTSATLIYSIAFAAAYGSCFLFNLMALKVGPLSLTALILQYSLILPTIYGLVAFDEPIDAFLIIGISLLLVSLVLINLEKRGEKKKITLKWGIYAALAFLGNGACSIIQKIQQTTFNGLYKSEFMIVALLIASAVLMIFALLSEKKSFLANIKKGFPWYIICGLANGLVNLLVLVLTLRMPASVMFPIISAGGIVSMSVISIFIYKERLSVQQKVGLLLGTVAIIALNL